MSKEHDETQYRIEPLGDQHDRAAFSCGVEVLDRYLQKQAGQDVSRRVAAAFVITPDGKTIAGFYTLSAHLVNLADLPESVAKRLPRYPNVPATLLGRLAVSENFRGQGIGELLLLAEIAFLQLTLKVSEHAMNVGERRSSSACIRGGGEKCPVA